ncbi:ABC transporter permease subunit [Phytoactinopolyspora endophytica]|uniref:ABC transporter permease subunit n=1 Tax=Phytoactinopolyspora endophytica TaxID=1642495 RepID=UPI00101C7906|nr:ABC transporter permease subunit [Phytoactinopolyspora endophytica]
MTDVVRAEWLKMASVRFTAWSLLLTVLLGVGLSYLFGLSFRNGFSDTSAERQDFEPLFATFYSLTLAQLALVVFGVLVVGSELSTGTIRTSLAAVPQRGVFYAGKVLAVASTALGVSTVTVLGAYVTAQVALGPHRTSLGADGTVRAIVSAWLYLPLICLFGLGLAMMLGSSVRTLAVVLPVFFLGSQGLGNVPHVSAVAQYLPDQAGMVAMNLVGPQDDPQFARDYGPWIGLGILTLWAAAALIGGGLALRRRDI